MRALEELAPHEAQDALAHEERNLVAEGLGVGGGFDGEAQHMRGVPARAHPLVDGERHDGELEVVHLDRALERREGAGGEPIVLRHRQDVCAARLLQGGIERLGVVHLAVLDHVDADIALRDAPAHGDGAIARAAVAHDYLDAIEGLVERALEGADDTRLGVAHDEHDRRKRLPHGMERHVPSPLSLLASVTWLHGSTRAFPSISGDVAARLVQMFCTFPAQAGAAHGDAGRVRASARSAGRVPNRRARKVTRGA